MPAPNTLLTGEDLLAAVTEAMVALHQRYQHRDPVTAKTLLLGGELLVCVLGALPTLSSGAAADQVSASTTPPRRSRPSRLTRSR